MLESAYQRKLIKRLEDLFPGCVILKNDADYRQGIPDLLILWGPYWAALEVKADRNARERPNQDHYIRELNKMYFARFIYPENEEVVLRDLQQAFGSRRSARVPQRQ